MLRARRLMRAPVSGGWKTAPGFPDASNTGATLPALFTITGSSTTAAAVNTALGISGNSGWSWNGTAFTIHTGDTIDSLSYNGGLTISVNNVTVRNSDIFGGGGGELTISGGVSGTTISNCRFTDSSGGGNGNRLIEMTGTTSGTTIQDCTIRGGDATTNRIAYGIRDLNASTGLQILRCNIYWWRAGLSLTSGLVQDCYIHDAGFWTGDHTECFVATGLPASPGITFRHNTLLNQLAETAAIQTNTSLSPFSAPVQHMTVDNNLMAGGDYPLYCGNSGAGGAARNWQITDTACSISGGTTLNDTSLVAGDSGATVTGSGIPAFTTISAVTPGVSATLSQACTNSGSVDVTFHYNNNITVTNNHFSTMFYAASGTAGTHANYDPAVGSNTWTGNVIHETGAPVSA